MRRFLLIVGGFFTLAVLGYGCYALVSLMAHERTRSEISFAQVDTVDVDLDAGGLELLAAEGARTYGVRIVDRGLRRPAFREWMEGTTLHIESDCPNFAGLHCGVRYQLAVPAGISVRGGSAGGSISITGVSGAIDVSSSGGGISATDTTGALTLDSSGGAIRVTDSAGPLALSCSGGGIRLVGGRSQQVVADASGGGVRLEFIEAPTMVDARSSGGGVRVLLPPGDSIYAIDADSSGGDTRIDVRQDPASARKLHLRSSGGGVRVQYEDSRP